MRNQLFQMVSVRRRRLLHPLPRPLAGYRASARVDDDDELVW